MNKDIAEGKWEQLKGTIKEKWGELTDDDLTQINGNAQKMYGILQEKYGKQKEEVEQEIDNFWDQHNRM